MPLDEDQMERVFETADLNKDGDLSAKGAKEIEAVSGWLSEL